MKVFVRLFFSFLNLNYIGCIRVDFDVVLMNSDDFMGVLMVTASESSLSENTTFIGDPDDSFDELEREGLDDSFEVIVHVALR